MPFKLISKLGRLRPLNSLDHGLHVCKIIASKCICKLARSWSWSASPSRLNHGLQVYLQFSSNTTTTCMSKLAWSRLPTVSPNMLNYGLQGYTILGSKYISKPARSWSRSASLSSLYHDLHVYHPICLITASKCISKLAWYWPRSVSLSSLDHHFQTHLISLSSTACSQSRYTFWR